MNILLHPVNTKTKRAESHRVPEEFVPYIMHYLKEIRPVCSVATSMMRSGSHIEDPH